MSDLEFSVISTDSPDAQALRAALTEFEARTRIQVRLQVHTWDTAWTELIKVALYSDGPDVSEIGSTWLRNFVDMNSVHPLSPAEVKTLGDPASFVPVAWENTALTETAQLWAVPWLIDTRILYYRLDLLEAAGIDEQGAFHTPQALEQTLARLQKSGADVPWAVPTQLTGMTLHNIAAWVWGNRGSFVSPDGKRVLFNQPEARAGIKAYFALGRYLGEAGQDLSDQQSDTLFWTGQAAVALSGPWLLQNPDMDPKLAAKTGTVLPPGVPFVGGSHLVIWNHSSRVREAMELVRFLTGLEFQQSYVPRTGLLPVRLEALINSDSSMSSGHLMQSLAEGRSFPPVPSWGLVEERLGAALAEIWKNVLESEKPDLDKILDQHLAPLTKRLELALKGA